MGSDAMDAVLSRPTEVAVSWRSLSPSLMSEFRTWVGVTNPGPAACRDFCVNCSIAFLKFQLNARLVFWELLRHDGRDGARLFKQQTGHAALPSLLVASDSLCMSESCMSWVHGDKTVREQQRKFQAA